MKYISFCSGIEAASVAWQKLGWEPVAFSEIDEFPCEVLKERFPTVPNLGDCRNIHYSDGCLFVQEDEKAEPSSSIKCGTIDVAVGGFPCQSLSLVGRREGLAGESGLILEYPRLCAETGVRWMVYENVPGMLSSKRGADFAHILSRFAGWDVPVPRGGWKNSGIIKNNPFRGYGLAWRTLDAQYTRVPGFPRAVPQRRRRVFLVGYRSQPVGDSLDWTYPTAVLFNGETLSGNPPQRGKGGQESAGCSSEGSETTAQHEGKNDRIAICIGNGQAHEAQASIEEVCNTLNCMHETQKIAIVENPSKGEPICIENHAQDSRYRNMGNVSPTCHAQMGTGGNNVPLVLTEEEQEKTTLRMLMPIETERLMGLPDNWTRIPWKRKSEEQCPDNRRYKACGNSFCVNCIEWIGRRIQMVEDLKREEEKGI